MTPPWGHVAKSVNHHAVRCVSRLPLSALKRQRPLTMLQRLLSRPQSWLWGRGLWAVLVFWPQRKQQPQQQQTHLASVHTLLASSLSDVSLLPPSASSLSPPSPSSPSSNPAAARAAAVRSFCLRSAASAAKRAPALRQATSGATASSQSLRREVISSISQRLRSLMAGSTI